MESNQAMGTDRSDAYLRPGATGVLRRLGLILAPLACTAGFLIASTSTASATLHKTTTHHKAKPKPKHKKAKPVASSASVCSYLNDSAGSAKFTSEIGADEKSGNFTAMKQLFLNLASAMEKASGSGDAALRSAPANVQAAIKTIGSAVPQLKTAIGNATTESQLLLAFGAMGSTPGISSAEKTLSAYSVAHCGG